MKKEKNALKKNSIYKQHITTKLNFHDYKFHLEIFEFSETSDPSQNDFIQNFQLFNSVKKYKNCVKILRSRKFRCPQCKYTKRSYKLCFHPCWSICVDQWYQHGRSNQTVTNLKDETRKKKQAAEKQIFNLGEKKKGLNWGIVVSSFSLCTRNL